MKVPASWVHPSCANAHNCLGLALATVQNIDFSRILKSYNWNSHMFLFHNSWQLIDISRFRKILVYWKYKQFWAICLRTPSKKSSILFDFKSFGSRCEKITFCCPNNLTKEYVIYLFSKPKLNSCVRSWDFLTSKYGPTKWKMDSAKF